MSREQTKSNNEKRQFWQMAIKTWRNSGMSVSKFCKAEGLSEGTFEKIRTPPGRMSLEVDVSKLAWILEGIDLFKARRRKRYKRRMFPQAK